MTGPHSVIEGEVKVRLGKVGSLSLYEITDYELELLERGSPGSIYLNFGVFALSTAISFLVALMSTDIPSDRTYLTFAAVFAGGTLAGIILLCLWWRSRKTISTVVRRIRQRIPDDEIIKVP